MQFLVMCLLLAVIGGIATVSIIMNFTLEKKFDSITKTIRGVVGVNEGEGEVMTMAPTISDAKLNSVLDGLEFYKEQTERWHSESVFWKNAYDNESESLIALEERFKKVEREVSNLRYIVDKMDGKEIVRDENRNITNIRLVK